MESKKWFQEGQIVKYNTKLWIVIGMTTIDGFIKYRLKRGSYRATAFAEEIEVHDAGV